MKSNNIMKSMVIDTLLGKMIAISDEENLRVLEFADAVRVKNEAGANGLSIMAPGNFVKDPISTFSFGLALMFGTAGLPHILMRFFTVPNAKEARKSVFYATGFIGYFYILTFINISIFSSIFCFSIVFFTIFSI